MSDPFKTLPDDISGLKHPTPGITYADIERREAQNIAKSMASILYNEKRVRTFQFTHQYFQKLHKSMFGDVWKWAGKWRQSVKNIGQPPQLILLDIITLEKDVAYFETSIESACRLHHRAVQIHPFENGNGRWSRMLCNIYLIQKMNGYIDWPVQMGEQNSPIRGEYISALKEADGLNYAPLVTLHSRYFKKRSE